MRWGDQNGVSNGQTIIHQSHRAHLHRPHEEQGTVRIGPVVREPEALAGDKLTSCHSAAATDASGSGGCDQVAVTVGQLVAACAGLERCNSLLDGSTDCGFTNLLDGAYGWP